MAKSSGFFGLRRGSTKSLTFSVLKGAQITKDRVTDVANPKTMSQTEQRIPFAQAVKFYKHAIAQLYRFAFQDKKAKESDYNAFIRHNVARACSVSLDNYKNNNYPSIGNYLMSAGDLVQADYNNNTSNFLLNVGTASGAVSTIGALTPVIKAKYPTLVDGDIVTFVLLTTSVGDDYELTEQKAPKMRIIQFVLDAESTVTLQSLGFTNMQSNDNVLMVSDMPTDAAWAGCVIFSRNTENGLRVSNAELAGETIWNNIIEGKSSIVAKKADAIDWGAKDMAILQGALAE